MSYVAPLGSAAHLHFDGLLAYTAPLGSAANLSFIDKPTASSIGVVTRFGTPTGRMNYFLPASTVAPSAMFGTPRVKPGQQVNLSVSTRLGVPSVPTRVAAFGPTAILGAPTSRPAYWGVRPISPTTTFGTAHVRAGKVMPTARSTAFGVPYTIGGYWQHRSPEPSTRFSQAYTKVNQTTATTGFFGTKFGVPLKYSSQTTTTGVICQAFSFTVTYFGAPKAKFKQAVQVAAWAKTTAIGAPDAKRVGHHSGFATTLFGAARARGMAHVVGFQTSRFGQPTAKRRGAVAGIAPTVRFGVVARYVLSRRAYGINSSNKFGHPVGRVRINHKATGFLSAHVGASVTSRDRHRVSHIPPTATFSTHQLRRTT